jgi:hypothetical protein
VEDVDPAGAQLFARYDEARQEWEQYRKKKHDIAEAKRKIFSEESQRSAEQRCAVIKKRLAAAGLSRIFYCGVQGNKWDSRGHHFEVYVVIDGGQGQDSEKVANRLLDILEGKKRLAPA